MRVDRGDRSVWHQQGRKWRMFARIWLPLTIVFLISTFFIADLHWGTRVSAVGNVVTGLIFLWMTRIRSSADCDGIDVTQVRTRRLTWAAVENVHPSAPGQRGSFVQATLTDGTTIPLPGVPVADLPRLQELRAGNARLGSPGC